MSMQPAHPVLRLYTARIGRYTGSDTLDITRMTAEHAPTFPGSAFAPPRWLLNVALGVPGARAFAHAMAPTGYVPRRAQPQAFTRWYEARYREAMEPVAREGSPALEALLARANGRRGTAGTAGTVTLLCFCENPAACHRVMLARLLVERWPGRVSYEGERDTGADR